jgi:myo-inositol-1(or 4)-monophosphatase
MNEPTSGRSEPATNAGLIAQLVDQIIRAVNEANEQAALERVAKLRAAQPEASAEMLAQQLIRQKCLQAGAVGAVTSGLALIPGGGTMVTFTFGVTADLGLTLKMQAELVLEIAAVYQHRLSRQEKRQATILITGLGVAANQLLDKAGTVIAQHATRRLAEKSAEKALPGLGVAASAGRNILTTYLVGRRAQAYFSLGPEAVGNWSEDIKGMSGVDARKVIDWLVEATESSWQLLSRNSQEVTVATIGAGQSVGQVALNWSGQAGGQALTKSRDAAALVQRAATSTVETGQKLGKEAAIGANIAAGIAAETGRDIITTTASQASAAARKLTGAVSRTWRTPPDKLSPDLRTAIQAAQAAGEIVRTGFQSEMSPESKGVKGLVTKYDRLAEQAIVEILQANSGYSVLGEESGLTRTGSDLRWVIDPIDGTANFFRKLPLFAVSIALMKESEVLLGVILNPLTEECFFAEQGRGAFMNGQPIRVSANRDPAKSLIILERGYAEADLERMATLARRLGQKYGVRILGSSALELCTVANGSVDIFICSGDELWDYAAAIPLIREAGGQLTDWRGQPWDPQTPFVLASNGLLHEMLVSELADMQPG